MTILLIGFLLANVKMEALNVTKELQVHYLPFLVKPSRHWPNRTENEEEMRMAKKKKKNYSQHSPTSLSLHFWSVMCYHLCKWFWENICHWTLTWKYGKSTHCQDPMQTNKQTNKQTISLKAMTKKAKQRLTTPASSFSRATIVMFSSLYMVKRVKTPIITK